MVLVEKRIKVNGPDMTRTPCGLKVLNHPQRIQLHVDCCTLCQAYEMLAEVNG